MYILTVYEKNYNSELGTESPIGNLPNKLSIPILYSYPFLLSSLKKNIIFKPRGMKFDALKIWIS